MIILFGIAIFSLIMGNFIDMLMEFKVVTAENEDNSDLSKWFGLLARFNKGRPLSKEITRKIESYFDYYWAQDRNYGMKKEEDKRFMSELPKKIRVSVCMKFLIAYRSTKTSCSKTSYIIFDRIFNWFVTFSSSKTKLPNIMYGMILSGVHL
jgi:hypothetical protein